MKIFLFLLLFSFSAHAQSSYYTPLSSIVPSLWSGFLNPNQVYVEGLPCVQNNFEKCSELGYTQTFCENGGIACPYDSTLFNCSSWSCEELGLFSAKPDNMECEKVQMPTLACFKCVCGAGFVNYEDCDGLVKMLAGDETICDELGYKDSITDCAEYLVCPANGNRVRCLDTIGCKETDCIAETEVPANADPILESKDCKCGGAKEVVTGWTCKSGFKKEGNACAAEVCAAGEFEGPAPTDPTAATYELKDCYGVGGNTAAGWTKVATENKSGKQCYRCECVLPSNCAYTASDKQEFGKLEDMCCDNEHYIHCMRNCPTSKHVPSIGAVADKKWCKACGEETEYISGWHCKDGYILSSSETACDPRPCPQNGNGKYYSTVYENTTDCENLVQKGVGWEYVAEPAGAKSGEGYCHLCSCPYSENDATYKYSESDTSNRTDAVLSGLGCNGKYRECRNLKEDEYFTPGGRPAHAQFESLKVCGQPYYRFTRCDTGYEYMTEDKECLPKDCTGYNIEDACPEWGNCSRCVSAGTIKYRLDSCRNDVNVRYEVNSTKTECCVATCDENDDEYFVGTCPAGKSLVDTKLNGCGQTCVKCI